MKKRHRLIIKLLIAITLLTFVLWTIFKTDVMLTIWVISALSVVYEIIVYKKNNQ